MKIYDVSRLPSSITLGWDGENNWRPIAFDCSALLAGHSDAVVTLWLLPKGESQAFPVTLSRDGNTVTWTPLNEEMTAEHGQLQIVVQDGTDVGKSKVVDYTVHDSLVSGADHPAETPSWATQVVEDVTEATSHYPRIVDGNWYVWDVSEQEWVDTGVAAGGGDISPEDIADAVADYLEEHPVEVTETDPTVPSWAKQPTKPTYTAQEVGALPSNTPIPSKTSDLTNDSGFLTEHQSLSAYRTASVQDSIDAAQDAAIGAKYSKPSGGIPASDIADGVIPAVPQMADDYVLDGMDDWTAGKTVDAATLKNAMNLISQGIASKANASSVYTKTEIDNKGYLTQHQSLAGYATESYVQTQIAAIPDELPAVTSTDNGKFLRVVNGAWAAQAVPSAESASFGGGS